MMGRLPPNILQHVGWQDRARSDAGTRAGPVDAKSLSGTPGAAGPSKPAAGRHEAIEAQIRDEVSVMQGVMICDLY